jgi:acetylornithine deacetylase/succinyl-diaminopimelate desuccinylase-like protein
MPLPRDVHVAAESLFRDLLRIDTTNPPGNETPAANLLADYLRDGGLEPEVLESAPGRGNVVARLKGKGEAPPILLLAHLDVVPAEDGPWTKPPFAAEDDGTWLYGRGAVDMKNMAAMSAAILRRLAEEGAPPDRDVIFAGVADEESGCDYGSGWLVDHHPDLVRAEYMVGEVGGFSLYIQDRTFYPIMVAEKGIAWIRAVAKGESGHGSMPREDSAVVRLAEAVARIGRTRLPQHRVAAVEDFLRQVAASLPVPARYVLPRLMNQSVSGFILDKVLPSPALSRAFAAALSNTASPTVMRAGVKTNVIPGEASVELDGRTLPGQSAADLVRELEALVGAPHLSFEVIREAPPVETTPDTPLFATMCEAVRRGDPDGIPVPYMIPGFTDAKALHRLGTKCYGFAPVRLPKDGGVAFGDLYHRPDERIPLEGFHWGLDVLDDAVRSFVLR